MEFRQHPADRPGLHEQAIFLFAQGIQRFLAQLQEPGCVAGAVEFGFDGGLLVRPQARR